MSEIYEKKGTVTLINGVGMFRYKLRNPTPSVSKKIGCAVSDPVNKSINIFVNPGDIAPPMTPETFDVTTSVSNGYVVYDVVSNLMYSDTSAAFNVKETSVDIEPPETFTITGSRSGSTVTFTVRSNRPASIAAVNVTMTEYRPGSPITIIKTQSGTVQLNNGAGTTSFVISQMQPPVDQKVEGKLTATPTVSTEVTVPKYVPPYVPPPAPTMSITGYASGKNATFRITSSDRSSTERITLNIVYTASGSSSIGGPPIGTRSVPLTLSGGVATYTYVTPRSQYDKYANDKDMWAYLFYVSGQVIRSVGSNPSAYTVRTNPLA